MKINREKYKKHNNQLGKINCRFLFKEQNAEL